MAGVAAHALILISFVSAAAIAQQSDGSQYTRATLEQASSRNPADFSAAYEGRKISVQGQIASTPVWAAGPHYLPLRDATDHGLILKGEHNVFANFEPGDWIEARGVIETRAGLVLLAPDAMEKIRHEAPPAVKKLSVAELAGFRYLGLRVESQGSVTRTGENTGGKILQISDRGAMLAVFLANAGNPAEEQIMRIRPGDRVWLTGLATQYDPRPPYDQGFQILLASPADIEVIGSGSMLSPMIFLSALGIAGLILGLWWIRERRISAQRREMRVFHTLCEDIIAAGSPAEIAEKLMTVLPPITQATGIWLYLFNRRTNSLERVPTVSDPEPVVAPVEAAPEGLASGVAACFRNRAPLNIPDVRRSSFVNTPTKMSVPRSAMILPLIAQNDVLGVIEAGNANGLGYFPLDEQAELQHVANQIAAALKLQEQRIMREQLFRSEKLAATGQLISGVASELRAPLESIVRLASSFDAHRMNGHTSERDLRLLAAESRRASEIVSRMVSLARPDDSTTEPADINMLLASLMRFREPEWKAMGLRVQNRLAPEPAFIAGAQGQIEQVFLNLLVHAEQSAVAGPAKTIIVATSVMAGCVLIEISYSTQTTESSETDPFAEGRPLEGALTLSVCRSIIHNHGGDLRFQARSAISRFEVELPTIQASEPDSAAEVPYCTRPLTLVLIDPDPGAQRQLLGLLSLRGHRVIPAAPEDAANLVQRLKFDAALWAVRHSTANGSLNGGDFQGIVRSSVGAFVLLSDGYDAELARSIEDGGGFLLGRPIKEPDLDRILRKIELRTAALVRR